MKVFLRAAAVVLVALSPLSQASAQSAAAKWKGIVGNKVLTHKMNVGAGQAQIPGLNMQSGGVKTTVEVHLCNDGSFVRFEKTDVAAQAANVLGLNVQSAGNSSTSKSTGRWKITSATSANAVIQLIRDADSDLIPASEQKLNISYNGSATTVNGERWSRAASSVCR